MAILRRANRRHFFHHPIQLLLAIFGVALGVAMVVSIDLAAGSTHRAFSLSMEALTGRYTHHVSSGPAGLPEAFFTRLRVDEGLRESAPAVEGYATINGSTLRLAGFDPFTERNLRSRFVQAARSDDAVRLLTEPDTVMLSALTARRLGVRPGETLEVNINGQLRTLRVVAYVEGSAAPDPALEGLVLADIATAQELLGRLGVLDRIDLVLTGGPEQERHIRSLLPPGAELASAAGRNSATQSMTAAFELNLRAMSLLALLVGIFLIYNTMAFSVLQRRELLATLRIVGATRGQLLREVLIEAAALGFVGAVFGLAFGVLAAHGLLHMVTRTINDLYFVLTVNEFILDPMILLRGLALGITAAVVAALLPALEAAWSSPLSSRSRSEVENAARRGLPWLAAAGTLGIAIGIGLLQADTLGLVPAIIGVFLLLLGYGLLTPALLLGFAALTVRFARLADAWLVRLAVRGVAASVSRAGLAIAALTIAVSVSVGVGTMIASFRGTIEEWLTQILQADIYVSTPSSAARHSPPLPEGLQERLSHIAGVDKTEIGRRIVISTSLGESDLLALDPPYIGRPGLRFKHADGKSLWAMFPTMQAVFVSEAYAQRHRLSVGDHFKLATDSGPISLPVAGIFFDYRSDQGLILMHRALYNHLWKDKLYTSVGLYLQPGFALATVRSEVERLLAEQRQPLLVRSNREIRATSMESFERTFAVTQVLRLLAVGVAFVGILSALLAFQYERKRELAILRSTGLTPAQAGRLVLLQTGFMGLTAGLLSIPLGLAIALALVRVINLRSFGWTMDLIVPLPPLLAAVALALVAALLAGLYPAYQAMRVQPSLALREEKK